MPSIEISAVIPAYNAADKITNSIHSVFAQTLPPIELIVVDDGSKDATGQVVQELGRQYEALRLVSQANGGVSSARNAGIQVARGNWIAFLDSDDQWLPDRLEKQVALLRRHQELNWVAGAFFRRSETLTSEQEGVLSLVAGEIRRGETEVVEALQHMAGKTSFWTGTMLIRKTALIDAGLFDTELRVAEDSDLWTRIALQNPKIGFVASPIAIYTTNSAGSLTGGAIRSVEQSQFAHYRKILAIVGDSGDERQKRHLLNLLSHKIESYTKCLIRAGNTGLARSFIDQLRKSGLPVPSSKIRMMSWIPSPAIRATRRLRSVFSKNADSRDSNE